MAVPQIIKCKQYDMMKLNMKPGQIYYCTDSVSLYQDMGPNKSQRKRLNAKIVYSDNERLERVKPVAGLYYYVSDTNCLWLYDGRWILKVGSSATYNSYSTNNGILSPVISTNPSVTTSNGDKIVDNNGLLGNGSVCIRDSNRTIRANLNADIPNGRIQVQSYLDDGFLFIPNAHLPFRNISQSYGALHLTVDKKEQLISDTFDYSGHAYYYGEWNNIGDMYIVTKTNNSNIKPSYTPISDREIVKLRIICYKQQDVNGEMKLVKTYITIRPLTTTTAIVEILSIYDEDSNSVVQNDMGDWIYSTSAKLYFNDTFECTRQITTSQSDESCTYNFSKYNNSVTVKYTNSTTNHEAEVPIMWNDGSKPVQYSTDTYRKSKILTEDDIELIKSKL